MKEAPSPRRKDGAVVLPMERPVNVDSDRPESGEYIVIMTRETLTGFLAALASDEVIEVVSRRPVSINAVTPEDALPSLPLRILG